MTAFLTPAQDAELYLRRRARDIAEISRKDEGLIGASQDLLLIAESHGIRVANLLEAAADWIRDTSDENDTTVTGQS